MTRYNSLFSYRGGRPVLPALVLVLAMVMMPVAAESVLPGYTNIFVKPANDAGARWNYEGNTTYFINELSGGLNVVHISTDPAVSAGQVTVSSNQSGTFYLTDSGGSGYEDEGVLLLAVNGTLPSDFTVRIRTSGYTWVPGATVGEEPTSAEYSYQSSALDETFAKADFVYGPQNWKPSGADEAYPLFYEESMGSSVNQFHLLFIDTRAGILGKNHPDYDSLTNKGAVKVQYTFTNLSGNAAFNVYGWQNVSAYGRGMGWTNALTGSTSSGYRVVPLSVPVAAFSRTPVSGEAPLTVAFTDTSTGAPYAWAWTFGDGGTSTEQNPSHTYTAAGTYTVNLTATNTAGSNKVSKTGSVTVTSTVAPVAAFSADVTSGTAPLAVTFTDASTHEPTSWAWTFGDGGTSTERSPSHTYTTAGTYTVNLTAKNSAGSDYERKAGYITVSASGSVAPVAAFAAASRAGLAPLTVTFTDRSTNSPTSWAWTFGDGGTSTVKNPSHTYTTVGNYTVTLTATNSHGSNTTSVTKYVAVITKLPLSYYHFINVYMANDEGVKYDVPDGVYASGGAYTYVNNTYWVMFRNAGGGTNPLHISSTGTAWTDADVTTTTAQSGSFYVTHSGGQPTMPEAILMIAVNGTIPDDFSVHIKSTGQVFDVGTPQTYNQGLPAESTFVEGAVDQTFTKADFIYGPQSWKPHSTADYPIFVGEDQTNPLNQFQLMFIDLRAGTIQNASLPQNGVVKVEYAFTNLPGNAAFNVYGWYMQSNHGTGIIMTNSGSGYTVVGTAPVAAFTTDKSTGAAPLTVQFTDTSMNAASRAWDFNNDGTTDSTAQNPSHVYSTAGTYTAKLTVTGSSGATDSTTTTITVTGSLVTVPGCSGVPTDPDSDGKYEDVNGNGDMDFNDVMRYFNQMEWIEANEPVTLFDYNGNGGIDFQDLILLFNEM